MKRMDARLAQEVIREHGVDRKVRGAAGADAPVLQVRAYAGVAEAVAARRDEGVPQALHADRTAQVLG